MLLVNPKPTYSREAAEALVSHSAAEVEAALIRKLGREEYEERKDALVPFLATAAADWYLFYMPNAPYADCVS